MHRRITNLDRIGSIGAVITAIMAPCCFPIFAAVSAGLGLGVLGKYETLLLLGFQILAALSIVGLASAYRSHHRLGPLVLGAVSGGILAYAFYVSFLPYPLYAGLFGLVGATLWNQFVRRARGRPLLQSILTCPACGHRVEETMPTNACLFFYDCPACKTRLKPKAGDCCVFCSYGSAPCPPIQLGDGCCA